MNETCICKIYEFGGKRKAHGRQNPLQRIANASSALGLTVRKVKQVLGLHVWGTATGRNCLHPPFELVVRILILQAHEGTHQSLGTPTLLHILPMLEPGIAEGGDRRGWAVDSSKLEGLTYPIYPTLQPDAPGSH